MTMPEERESRISTADMPGVAEPRADESYGGDGRSADGNTGRSTMAPDATPVARSRADTAASEQEPLVPSEDSTQFRDRWSDIQAGFVDEPRKAVEQADSLVAEVMQRLAKVFADERGELERQWDTGGEVDTEELRQALRRYRSFFDRLLSM